MKIQDAFNRLGNPMISALLRSPLHGWLDASTLLVSVRGRRSGRSYTTPVNYWADGDRLTIVSLRQRTWWRNLRSGAEVGLHLRGAARVGWAVVAEDAVQVSAALAEIIRRQPAHARLLGIRLQPDGTPEAQALARAAQSRVVVSVDVK